MPPDVRQESNAQKIFSIPAFNTTYFMWRAWRVWGGTITPAFASAHVCVCVCVCLLVCTCI